MDKLDPIGLMEELTTTKLDYSERRNANLLSQQLDRYSYDDIAHAMIALLTLKLLKAAAP